MEKRKIIIIGLILLLLSMIGVTYAYWITVLKQNDENDIVSSCFNVSFSEDTTGIQLQKAYPITDEEGKNLTPYTFSIVNNCSTLIFYEINLEALDSTTLDRFDLIKIQLDEEEPINLIEETTPTIKEATKAFKIGKGYFKGEGTKQFNLKIWVDEKVTVEDNIQNTSFLSKVSIKANYVKGIPLIDTLLDLPIVTEKAGLYEVDHTGVKGTIDNTGFSKKELRFAGKSDEVNNYINFDGDMWRIIGLVNVLIPQADGTNEVEQRVKIISTYPLYGMIWDKSEESENSGLGVNEWSQADLMKILNPGFEEEPLNNSLYWNGQNGNCFDGRACSFSGTKMPESLKELIEEVVWNTGTNGENGYTIDDNGQPFSFYEYERSDAPGDICKKSPNKIELYCSDTVTRNSTWKGKVGLIYPSDYGFATSGNSESEETNRMGCLKTAMHRWNEGIRTDCAENNWLKANENFTMMAASFDTVAINIFEVLNDAHINSGYASNGGTAYPVVYLKKNTLVKTGDGSLSQPFELFL